MRRTADRERDGNMRAARQGLIIAAVGSALGGCAGVLDPAGPVGAADADDPDRRPARSCWRRRPDHPARLLDGVALPRLEHQGRVSAALVLLRPHRGGDLVDPDPGDHVPGRRDLDRLAPARPLQAAALQDPAGGGAGRRRWIGSGCSSTRARASPRSTSWWCRPARRCTSRSPRPACSTSSSSRAWAR